MRVCRRRVLLSLRSYQRTYFALSERLACHANPNPGNILPLSRDTWRLPPRPWDIVEAGNSFLPGLSCVTSVHAPPPWIDRAFCSVRAVRWLFQAFSSPSPLEGRTHIARTRSPPAPASFCPSGQLDRFLSLCVLTENRFWVLSLVRLGAACGSSLRRPLQNPRKFILWDQVPSEQS